MISLPSSFLQYVRVLGTKFFHHFGIHCATHQIRLILVSSVVISSLLFPAISMYTSSQSQFFAGFTLRVLDPFFASDDLSTFFSHHDIRHLWEDYSTLRVREDSVARARCGMEGILRSERVFIGSAIHDDDDEADDGLGALKHSTLLATFELERRISETIHKHGLRCLTTPNGSCLVLSPSAFWNNNEQALVTDENILDTLNLSPNATVSGVPITPDMILAGREFHDPTSTHVDGALFLVLTYFFPDTDCLGNAGHFEWLHVLEEAARHSGELMVRTQAPKLIALEYDKNVSTRFRITSLSAFCCLAYFTFFVYCFRHMRRMDVVHSRLGLAFTGLVELLVSTITSVSVCALVGFRVTMVPWELFPLVVIFIGVENMFNIVDAVIKTSISLPVKERIAEGLGKAGTSNTLKVVSYNTVLGVIAFFSTGAIRQFCAFSIVVLVAHWFLVHTFFVTVLSIDIQRLELDELLRQGTTLGSSIPYESAPVQSPKTTWRGLVAATQGGLRRRAPKNISLFLLLAITATLYYATSPTPIRNRDDAPSSLSPLAHLTKPTPKRSVSPALHVWQVLNPSQKDLVHVRIESPTILVLNSEGDTTSGNRQSPSESEKPYRPRVSRMYRWWIRTVRPITWFFKIVIAPMAATTTLLYGLLLYLLKDAELLEAQRNRAEPDVPVSDGPPSVEDGIVFSTLPRAFLTDVELVACSNDGSIVAAVGMQNELVIWRTGAQTHTTIDTSDVLLGSASVPSAATTLTALAVSDDGTLCAAGTGSGIIVVWRIEKDCVKRLQHLSTNDSSSPSPVTQVCFTRPTSSTSASIHLIATYENSAVLDWNLDAGPSPRYITPSRSASVIKSMLLPVQSDAHRLLVGFSLEDGTFELCEIGVVPERLPGTCSIAAGNPTDLVCKVDICSAKLEGMQRLVIGAVTQAGVVSLWDGDTQECIFIFDEPFGDVGNLHVLPVPTKTCVSCGELPAESFSVSFSVGQVVLFYRAYLTLPTRQCSCAHNQPQQLPLPRVHSLGHRSRSSSSASVASSIGSTTPRSRTPSGSISSALNGSLFPISAHGVLSRRASEKDSLRRHFDETDEPDIHPVGPQDVALFAGLNPQSSFWQSLIVVRVGDTTFERGSWTVENNRVVGIRRRPRPPYVKGNGQVKIPLKPEPSDGLTAASLERWELWTFDPSGSRLQASALADISQSSKHSKRTQDASSRSPGSLNPQPRRRRSDVPVPRLHFTRVSPLVSNGPFCLGGFGNAVGVFRRDKSTPANS